MLIGGSGFQPKLVAQVTQQVTVTVHTILFLRVAPMVTHTKTEAILIPLNFEFQSDASLLSKQILTQEKLRGLQIQDRWKPTSMNSSVRKIANGISQFAQLAQVIILSS